MGQTPSLWGNADVFLVERIRAIHYILRTKPLLSPRREGRPSLWNEEIVYLFSTQSHRWWEERDPQGASENEEHTYNNFFLIVEGEADPLSEEKGMRLSSPSRGGILPLCETRDNECPSFLKRRRTILYNKERFDLFSIEKKQTRLWRGELAFLV